MASIGGAVRRGVLRRLEKTLSGSRYAAPLPVCVREPLHPGSQVLKQLLVGDGANHPVELRAIAGDQAPLLDQHVVDVPVISLSHQARLDRDRDSKPSDDHRAYRGMVSV